MCGGNIPSAQDYAAQVQKAQLDSISVPTAPDLMDTEVIQAQLQKKQELAGSSSRSSTFLTGPSGLGGTSSSIAKDFILAKFRDTSTKLDNTSSTATGIYSATGQL